MGDNEATYESCATLGESGAAPDPTHARLERVINDVISDHCLHGPAKQSAGDFTRKVCRSNLLCCDRYDTDGREVSNCRFDVHTSRVRRCKHLQYPPRSLTVSFSKIHIIFHLAEDQIQVSPLC